MQGHVTMYSTTWCGYCRRLKGQMERAGISYIEINIEQDSASAQFVESVNNGNQLVPTVLVVPTSGGRPIALGNPSLAQVRQALSA
jgi:mycoredoxin